MDSYETGEVVSAKWAGSRKFLTAKVMKVGKSKISVKFDDGTTSDLKPDEIRKQSRGRSPTKTKPSSPSRKSTPKSPLRARTRSRSSGRIAKQARKESPTKSPKVQSPTVILDKLDSIPKRGKSSSPGRRLGRPTHSNPDFKVSKSPERKRSTSRTRKPIIKTPNKTPKTTRTSDVKEPEFELVSITGNHSPKLALRDIFPKRSSLDVSKSLNYQEKSERVTRLRSTSIQKGTSQEILRTGKSAEKFLTREDDIQIIDLPEVAKKNISFLTSLKSIYLLLFLPLLCCFLILACVRNNGKLFGIPLIPKLFRSYVSPIPVGIYFGFVLLQALLMFLPLGFVKEDLAGVSKAKRFCYRTTGFASMLITCTLVGACYYYFKLPWDYITLHFLHLTAASILFSFALASILYIKSFYAPLENQNPQGNSGWFYHDMVAGREVHVRFGRLNDVKFLLVQIGLIGWIVVNVLLVYKHFNVYGNVQYTLAATAAMQILYCFDLLWRQEQLLATAWFMYEGTGLQSLLILCTCAPFFNTLPVLYLVNNKHSLPYYCLAPIGLLFVIGHFMLRKAAQMKYEIKRNPLSLKSRAMKSITYGRKNLVCSGPWGCVRYPGYLGDFLVFVAWTLPCGFAAGVPFVPLAFFALNIIARVLEAEKRMERRYGVAWIDYKQRVKFRLLPYVF